MAGFWRPRRQAETEQAPDGGRDPAVPFAPDEDVHDPELAAQLAHLEEIERRHGELYAQSAGADAEVQVHVPEEAWPEAIPPLPDPELPSVEPLLRWLDTARAVLSARASRNRDELQRYSSQWLHVNRDLARFRAEEVAAVVESQARLRERIAADETVSHLLRRLRDHLGERAAAGPADDVRGAPGADAAGHAARADVELVRRLLDDAALDRARSAQSVVGTALEALSGIALDMEVVQRQAEREPEGTPQAVHALQDRVSGVVEDLRALPGTELVTPRTGEPLHATLRRCLDSYQHRLAGDLAWSGGDPADPAVAAAVLWIVQDFLAGVTSAGGQAARIGMTVEPDGLVLVLTAEVAAPALEAGWVLRCRARAAVAGGTLVAQSGEDGRAGVEVRFGGSVGVSSAHPWGSAS